MNWLWASGEDFLLWAAILAAVFVALIAILLLGVVITNIVRNAVRQVRSHENPGRPHTTSAHHAGTTGRDTNDQPPPTNDDAALPGPDIHTGPQPDSLPHMADRRTGNTPRQNPTTRSGSESRPNLSETHRLGLEALKPLTPPVARPATEHQDTRYPSTPTARRAPSPSDKANSQSALHANAPDTQETPAPPQALPRPTHSSEQPPSLSTHEIPADLLTRVAQLEKTLDAERSARRTLQQALEHVARETADLSRTARKRPVLPEHLEHLEGKVRALEKHRDQADRALHETRNAVRALEKHRDQADPVLHEIRNAVRALEKQQDQADQALQDVVARLEALEGQQERLFRAVEDHGRRIVQAEASAAALGERQERMDARIDEVEAVRTELERMAEERTTESKRIAALEHEMMVVGQAVGRLEARGRLPEAGMVEALRGDVQAQGEVVARLDEAMVSLSARTRSLEERSRATVGGDEVPPPAVADDPDWQRVQALLDPVVSGGSATGAGRLERILRVAERLEAEVRLFIRMAQCLSGRVGAGDPWPGHLCEAHESDQGSVIRAEKELKTVLFGPLGALRRMKVWLSHGTLLPTPLGPLEAEALSRLVRPIGPGDDEQVDGSGRERATSSSSRTGAGTGQLLDLDHLIQTVLRRVVIPFLSRTLYLVYACPVERTGDPAAGRAGGARLAEVLADDLEVPATLTAGPDHFDSTVYELAAAMGWVVVPTIPYLHTLEDVRAWTEALLVEPRIYFEPVDVLISAPHVDRTALAGLVARVDVPLLHSEDRSRATSPKYGIVEA